MWLFQYFDWLWLESVHRTIVWQLQFAKRKIAQPSKSLKAKICLTVSFDPRGQMRALPTLPPMFYCLMHFLSSLCQNARAHFLVNTVGCWMNVLRLKPCFPFHLKIWSDKGAGSIEVWVSCTNGVSSRMSLNTLKLLFHLNVVWVQDIMYLVLSLTTAIQTHLLSLQKYNMIEWPKLKLLFIIWWTAYNKCSIFTSYSGLRH